MTVEFTQSTFLLPTGNIWLNNLFLCSFSIEEQGNEIFYLQNERHFGIERFIHDHRQRSKVCQALGLPPI